MARNNEFIPNNDYEDLALPMYRWLMSSCGAELRLLELRLIEHYLKKIQGDWLCSAGFSEQQYALLSDIMPHVLPLGSLSFDGARLRSDIHFWPVRSQSMDAVVLHHVLEWTKTPQRVLREASRVLCPGGTIVVVGFNPLGISSFCRFFSSRYPRQFRQAKLYSANVIIEWLNTLGFSCESINFGLRLAPFRYASFESLLQSIEADGFKRVLNKLPFGSIFITVAVKERGGLIFSEEAWRQEHRSVARPSYASASCKT